MFSANQISSGDHTPSDSDVTESDASTLQVSSVGVLACINLASYVTQGMLSLTEFFEPTLPTPDCIAVVTASLFPQ